MSSSEFFQPRIFTLEEASALLPQLRPTLTTLRDARARLLAAEQEMTERYHGGRGNGHSAPGGELDRLQNAISEAQNELDQAMHEIAELGCELKDPDRGMVDFRTMREGRVVYLCWLAHEPEIQFWHELDGGFAGRQAL
jgi:hypothetical protein